MPTFDSIDTLSLQAFRALDRIYFLQNFYFIDIDGISNRNSIEFTHAQAFSLDSIPGTTIFSFKESEDPELF